MGDLLKRSVSKLQTPIGAAVGAFVKYGGIRALGAILSSRKGIFGLIAIGASYWFLLGRLPEDAPVELVTNMAEIFGIVVSAVAGLFIGGTALEDAAAKRSSADASALWQVRTETTNVSSSGGSTSSEL